MVVAVKKMVRIRSARRRTRQRRAANAQMEGDPGGGVRREELYLLLRTCFAEWINAAAYVGMGMWEGEAASVRSRRRKNRN